MQKEGSTTGGVWKGQEKDPQTMMEGLGGGTCHSPKALPLNDESGKDLAVFHQGNSEDIPLTKN